MDRIKYTFPNVEYNSTVSMFSVLILFLKCWKFPGYQEMALLLKQFLLLQRD